MGRHFTSTPTRCHRRRIPNGGSVFVQVRDKLYKLSLTRDYSFTAEHVLKPSVSNSGLSSTSENVRPSTINVNLGHCGVIPLNGSIFSAIKRPSPTPSVKRNKVERLIKEHGSPPNVRVTAGGRIVPNDFTPLGSPRLSYAPLHRSNVPSKVFAPNRNTPFPGFQSTVPNGYVAVNSLTGELCQYIDNNIIPVRSGPHATSPPAFFMPPPNWPFPQIPSIGMGAKFGSMVNGIHPTAPPFYPQAPQVQAFIGQIPNQPESNYSIGDLDAQIKTLNDRYEALRQEKIQFEREEVKFADTWSTAQKTQAVEHKRKYVNDLDAIRKETKELESMKNGATNTSAGVSGVSGVFPIPSYMGPQDAQPFFSGLAVMPQPPASVIAPTTGMDWSTLPPARPASNEKNPVRGTQHQSPKSEPSALSRAPRRSRAILIKDPRTNQPVTEHSVSGLNPASPNYEPGKPFPLTDGSPPTFVVPAPSPIETPNPPPAELAKRYPWVFESDNKEERAPQEEEQSLPARMPSAHYRNGNETDENDVYSHMPSQHPTSHSSVTTTDFFPTNTHEHSFGKYMSLKASDSDRRSFENNPMTPRCDFQSDIVSPLSKQQHSKVPPVSPIDQRFSSFFRDIEMTPGRISEQISTRSRVRPEIREEFNGKSKEYLEGYVAATASNAPADKSQDYVNGYCDGLKSASAVRRSDSRSTSTVSVKSSRSVSNSKTPPNTANNLSNASLSDSRHQHYENVKLRETTKFLPLNNLTFAPNAEGASGLHNHNNNQTFPHHQHQNFSSFGLQQSSFSHVTRSYSELDDSSSPPKSGGLTHTPWEIPIRSKSLQDRFQEDIATASVTLSKPIPQRRDRVISTAFPKHTASLAHYSGNQQGQTAVVDSIPQHTYFGDDKYSIVPELRGKIYSQLSNTDRPAERSVGEWSAHSRSQIDGTMDELMAEMIAPMGQPKAPSMQSADRLSSKIPPHPVSTPPASPTKSNASPRKVTSPKARIQYLASQAREFLGSNSCGSGGDHGEKSRPESPDPKKMGPEEKRRWKEEWKNKFKDLKNRETADIRKYRKDNPL